MARKHLVSVLAVGVLAFGASSLGGAALAQVPANIAKALADPARPAADTARDAARHPGEVLALAEVKPGDTVVDYIMGGGYFTRLISAAVGPNGTVYAYQPAEFIKFKAQYGEDQKAVAAALSNVKPLNGPMTALDLPDNADVVITVQNYHDMHLKPFPVDTAAKANAEIFKSLKPGGVFLVIDHAAAAGSGITAADSLHRIDIAAVKSEVEAAGFKLEAESPLLASSADPHTASVFDPAIRGKTDQFILKFRKPK
ncbi:class I SAM-dependent methyltransferase [Caulobacter sp. RL271]|jgi:predicted methyltransferase|uniref:Class I SAM-dependent methyltransferase n=1 Tax=Caulobacter segnis TaxID=88688 RepID=A0ABY4ZXM8_9CAUL|nr:class I SAM-dependent methyltransferase [Caulobacter segnis]USQ97445.1 class I SAM-dependent methyltransferase [Caulobacter segnis]